MVLRLRCRDDLDRLYRAARPREARPLGRRPHRERVRHRSRGCDEKPSREGERHIKVAVFEVELAGANVGQGIPAVHIVVDDHTRIPLADLV